MEITLIWRRLQERNVRAWIFKEGITLSKKETKTNAMRILERMKFHMKCGLMNVTNLQTVFMSRIFLEFHMKQCIKHL